MSSIGPFVDRVIHADSALFLRVLPNECIDLVITDPPYLVDYRPRDRRRCNGDDNDYWLRPVFTQLYRVLKPDSFCATFYGWPHIDRFMTVWKSVGFRPVSHLVWAKEHCSRVGYTRSFHEVGFLLAKGKPPKPKLPPDDILPWEYTKNRNHTNEKPVLALIPLIEAFSKPGNFILDPFAGSGTTGVAAKAAGRRFILIEKVWHYCRVAERRLNETLSPENKAPSALPARVN